MSLHTISKVWFTIIVTASILYLVYVCKVLDMLVLIILLEKTGSAMLRLMELMPNPWFYSLLMSWKGLSYH